MSGFWRSRKYSSFVAGASAGYFRPQFLFYFVMLIMKVISLGLLTLLILGGAANAAEPRVSVAQGPLVMRLSKDEFRIAFGVEAERCAASGCHGVIRYRVDWKTEDGATGSEIKHVSYAVAPRTGRSIAVDRQYFDTAEGAHTTDITGVQVDEVTCLEGAGSRGGR